MHDINLPSHRYRPALAAVVSHIAWRAVAELRCRAFGAFGPIEGTGDVPPTESVSLGLRKSADGNTSGVVFLQFTFKLVAVK